NLIISLFHLSLFLSHALLRVLLLTCLPLTSMNMIPKNAKWSMCIMHLSTAVENGVIGAANKYICVAVIK
uniref:Uncharacterized protein n=1 Tax=Amphimedon queenslandica TaxID=400682 RepID=A0A1X7VT45_AMPQE